MNDQFAQYKRYLNVGIVVSGGLALIFFLLYFFGYGTLRLDLSSNQAVYINGNRVTERSVRLRPGSYEIMITSPRYKLVNEKVRINAFLSRTYRPELSDRSPDDIAAAALGSFGLYGPPGMTDVRWFDDDTWAAGIVGPGSAAPIALHYVENSWTVAYFDTRGYPKDLSALPAPVAQYLTAIGQTESPE